MNKKHDTPDRARQEDGLRQKALERELESLRENFRKSEERYRTAFEYTGTAMMVVEEDTSVSMWNHKLEEVTGYTQEDAYRGRKWTEFVVEEDLPRLLEYHVRRREDPSSVPGEYEFRLKHKNGRIRTILINVSLMPGGKQTLISLLDITERKKAEQERLLRAEEEVKEANRQVESLRREMAQQFSFRDMVSRSPGMKKIFDILPEMARTSATVLITGESGTGKELIARSLHDMGPRTGRPFVAINCSALPDTLLESELFGFKAGAFTDAKKDKPGKFAAAEGGTIFLDEIGDVSPALQVKLLRFLQEKTFEPLGGTRPVSSDTRVVAATNRNLTGLIKKGAFREDLYYRLKVLTIHLPPLRERRCDIPLLCDHFLGVFNNRYKKSIKELSREALDLLLTYEFTGNIRELENIMEHAFVYCAGPAIKPEHLPPDLRPDAPSADTVRIPAAVKNFEDLERVFLEQVLAETGGNRNRAAERLGIHRVTLFRKLKQLGLDKEEQ
jgi:PAS domain S-box-containing protein